MDPVIPDYRGATVAGIVPALLGKTDAEWIPEPARSARCVVLLVLDGLGWDVVRDTPERVPTLAAMEGGSVTTVMPATTAAALTSIATGLAPAQHGVTGFRIYLDGLVLNALRWTVEPRGATVDPLDIQRHAPFLGHQVPVVTKAEFERTGFTQAHLRDVPFRGWKTTSMLVEHCRRAAVAGERLVYAYYPGVDEVAHAHGLHDGFYAQELASADDLVRRLLAVLPGDAALLVTADHGNVHIEPDAWIETADLRPLVAAQAGDARFRSLYARKGAQRELADEARRRWSSFAWVRSRREVIDEGWIGPEAPSGRLPGRIGDVVVAPFTPVGFLDPALPRERGLRTAHGAPTATEMQVPLVAARGNA